MIMLLLDCTKNVFNAAVQVKRRKWRDRGTSSTKAFFFFSFNTGTVIGCVFQHPSLSHVCSFNGI